MSRHLPTKGSCNCGQVAFEIKCDNAALTDVYICHCSICRKSTGSGGIAVAIAPSTSLKWTNGKELVKTWVKPGHDWETSFCLECGSPLPGKNSEDTCYLPVSLLDSGHESLTVKHHIWVDSKASWEFIADHGKQHSNGFEG